MANTCFGPHLHEEGIEEGQRLRLEVPREAFAMHISRAEWISEILLQLKACVCFKGCISIRCK